MYATFWSLLPPIIAIALALITKEVYSSLFVGILAGGLLYSGFNVVGALEHVFVDGMIGALADAWNVGILIFLVILGGMVMLMNRAGGSAAFGRWAVEHVKSRVGAQCDHIQHVSTQLPYALTVAGISLVTYISASFLRSAALSLLLGVALTVGFLMVKRSAVGSRQD